MCAHQTNQNAACLRACWMRVCCKQAYLLHYLKPARLLHRSSSPTTRHQQMQQHQLSSKGQILAPSTGSSLTSSVFKGLQAPKQFGNGTQSKSNPHSLSTAGESNVENNFYPSSLSLSALNMSESWVQFERHNVVPQSFMSRQVVLGSYLLMEFIRSIFRFAASI